MWVSIVLLFGQFAVVDSAHTMSCVVMGWQMGTCTVKSIFGFAYTTIFILFFFVNKNANICIENCC